MLNRNPLRLSKREQELSELMDAGLTKPEIAKVMGVKPGTIQTLSAQVLHKLHVAKAEKLDLSRSKRPPRS